MVDTKGNDPKPNLASDSKSGPVKPPVLDLTARETKIESAKIEPAKSESIKPEPAKPERPKPADKIDIKPATPVPPKTPERPRTPPAAEPGFPIGATLAGAILGLAGAYGLALAGFWPSTPVETAATDPRIAQFATAIPELETVTQTTQSELAALNQRIATLENAEPVAAAAGTSTQPTDLSAVQAAIADLNSRLDALPAASEQTGDVDSLSADLAGVTSRLDELGGRLGTAEASLRTLDSTVAETAAAVSSQPADIGAVLQLPLILSGFETAFATGRPYEAELAALRTAAPDAAVPTAIANAAPTGLTRPDLIASRFDAVLPAIIAGRPADPDAQWQDGALDWFASAIALRPTGEIEGDTPEAVTSRLEGAIARRDFATAKTLFDVLPESMQAAAGDVPALVASQAEASTFLDTLRTKALSGEAAQ